METSTKSSTNSKQPGPIKEAKRDEGKWTAHDTAVCDKAEKSGVAINLKTGRPFNFTELDLLASAYDAVRGTISLDTFIKDKVGSVSFEEFYKAREMQGVEIPIFNVQIKIDKP